MLARFGGPLVPPEIARLHCDRISNDMSEPHQNQAAAQGSDAPAGSRRRFLGRLGAGVAPAVVTLASQPALGVTCFTPSRSLSRNTSISQTGKYGDCRNAESPGNYSTQSTPGTPAYHWPSSVPPTTSFHSVFSGSKYMVPKSGGGVRSLTMLEVLNLSPTTSPSDPDKVAFHIIGAYLNLMGGNGAVIPSNVLTVAELKIIWDEYRVRGYYEVMAGVKWYAYDIKSYLKSNGIVA
ncbi:MAG TPA: hypothetical protein VD932_06985 [Aquabacterium sp.]|nr:hypothetical protein [Aquabacterium sp.]